MADAPTLDRSGWRTALDEVTAAHNGHLLGRERPSLCARSFTPRRAPDCPLRQDGHGSHLPFSGYAGGGTGMVTNAHAERARSRTLTPATWSAGPARPHRRQRKWSRAGRLAFSVCPQRGQRCEV